MRHPPPARRLALCSTLLLAACGAPGDGPGATANGGTPDAAADGRRPVDPPPTDGPEIDPPIDGPEIDPPIDGPIDGPTEPPPRGAIAVCEAEWKRQEQQRPAGQRRGNPWPMLTPGQRSWSFTAAVAGLNTRLWSVAHEQYSAGSGDELYNCYAPTAWKAVVTEVAVAAPAALVPYSKSYDDPLLNGGHEAKGGLVLQLTKDERGGFGGLHWYVQGVALPGDFEARLRGSLKVPVEQPIALSSLADEMVDKDFALRAVTFGVTPGKQWLWSLGSHAARTAVPGRRMFPHGPVPAGTLADVLATSTMADLSYMPVWDSSTRKRAECGARACPLVVIDQLHKLLKSSGPEGITGYGRVIWLTNLGLFATTVRIQPDGRLGKAETVAVDNLADYGLPPLAELDAVR